MTPLAAVSLAPAVAGGRGHRQLSHRRGRAPAAAGAGKSRWPGAAAPLFSTLSWPGSHCGHCNARAALARQCSPSVLFSLRGRCRSLPCRLWRRYVLLEAGRRRRGAGQRLLFGWTAQGALCFLLLAILLALCAIDLAEMLLPDVLVLPLLPLGLLYQSCYGAGL